MRDTRTHGRFYATVGVMCDRYRRDAPPAYFVWKSTEVQSPQSAERPEVHATTARKHTILQAGGLMVAFASLIRKHTHADTIPEGCTSLLSPFSYKARRAWA